MNIDSFLSRRLNVIENIILRKWLKIESYNPFLLGSVVQNGIDIFFEFIAEMLVSSLISGNYQLKKFERELNEKIIWLIKKRHRSEIVKFFYKLNRYYESINSK